MLSSIRRLRPPEIDLIRREAALCVASDVALVCAGVDQFAFLGWHRFLLAAALCE
jgi:hypothetical protein